MQDIDNSPLLDNPDFHGGTRFNTPFIDYASRDNWNDADEDSLNYAGSAPQQAIDPVREAQASQKLADAIKVATQNALTEWHALTQEQQEALWAHFKVGFLDSHLSGEAQFALRCKDNAHCWGTSMKQIAAYLAATRLGEPLPWVSLADLAASNDVAAEMEYESFLTGEI